MTITNMTLIKIAAVGGVLTSAMGYLARDKIQSNIISAPFYKEAMQLVRTHPGAVNLLGEPIKEGNIDVAKDSKNFTEGNRAQFQVPLKGPKQKGTMFLSASKSDGDEQWILNSIELEVVNIPGKRLVIKKAVS